ncbi:hypothetical protein BGX23_007755 [Mortierella sp. AD031]|nr:hypothetical protein BGX23_007755 [Mortierella sp. AD031]
MSLRPTPTVFDIPELRLYLCRFLSQHDLTVCIRLNQTWFNTFVPVLWETVNVHDFDVVANRNDQSHTVEDWAVAKEGMDSHPARRYGRYIKYLRLGSRRSLVQLGSSLVSLDSLIVDSAYIVPGREPSRSGWDVDIDAYEPTPSELISSLVDISHENPFLSDVLLVLKDQDDLPALATAFGRFTGLEQLVLEGYQPSSSTYKMIDFLQNCTPSGNLKRIHFRGEEPYEMEIWDSGFLDRVELEEGGPSTDASFGIEQMNIGGSPNDETDLVAAVEWCGHSLQNLILYKMADENVRDLIRVVPQSCPNLRHLNIVVGYYIQPELWVSFLRVCPPLSSLKIIGCMDSSKSGFLDVLKARHAVTLRRTHLQHMEQFGYNDEEHETESGLLRILEFCPNLQDYWSSWITSPLRILPVTDQGDACPRPTWACASTLARLQVCFQDVPRNRVSMHGQDFLQRQTLEWLLQARGLKELGVSCNNTLSPGYGPDLREFPYVKFKDSTIRKVVAAAGMRPLKSLVVRQGGFHADFQ